MPGAQCTRSLACDRNKAHERSHHGHTGITRHSPRNGFTAYFVLSPARSGLFVTVILRLLGADLTPASRRQNHTTSPSASAPFVTCAARVHRIPPRVRDVRNAPLWDRTVIDIEVIWVRRKLKYFCKPFRKTRSDLPVGQNQLGCPVEPATQSGHGTSLAEREAGDACCGKQSRCPGEPRFDRPLSTSTLLPRLDLVECGKRSFKLAIEEPHRIKNFAEGRRCSCPVSLSKGEDAVVSQISHDPRLGNFIVDQVA